MTDLRQAAQQVLDALKLSAVTVDSFGVQQATQDAITALKAALEQQAEPVACPIGLDKKGASQFCSAGYCATCKQQQAEPVAMRMPKVGDKVICLEDESLGTVESLTAGGSPDIVFDDGSRGTYLLREFAELFGYVAAPQRPWVGLTAQEIQAIHDTYYRRMGRMEFAQHIEAKLKEKNSD